MIKGWIGSMLQGKLSTLTTEKEKQIFNTEYFKEI
jgi:hypothetical protein